MQPSLPRTAGSAVEGASQDERLARVLHRAAWQKSHQAGAPELITEDAREQGWTLPAITVGKSAPHCVCLNKSVCQGALARPCYDP